MLLFHGIPNILWCYFIKNHFKNCPIYILKQIKLLALRSFTYFSSPSLSCSAFGFAEEWTPYCHSNSSTLLNIESSPLAWHDSNNGRRIWVSPVVGNCSFLSWSFLIAFFHSCFFFLNKFFHSCFTYSKTTFLFDRSPNVAMMSIFIFKMKTKKKQR